MDSADATILAGASILAGAINSVGGGGSFVLFPTLIFTGTPPLMANSTNAIALWPGTGAAAIGYARDINVTRQTMLVLAITSVLGAAVGALLLLMTPEDKFAEAVPWILLVATLIFTFGRRLLGAPRARPIAIGALLQFLTAIYGGYFGGGMGILMLATFSVIGMDQVHSMNGLRSILAAIINGVAMIAFVVAAKIAWTPALVTAIGASLGGYVGASVARRIEPAIIRCVVLILAWGMTTWFMFDAYA